MSFFTKNPWLANFGRAIGSGLNAYDTVAGAPGRAVMGAVSGKGIGNAIAHQDQTQDLTHAFEKGVGLPSSGKGVSGAVEDFAIQTLTDPTTYIPGADLFSIGGRVAKALKIGEKLSKNPFVDKVLHDVVEGHDLRGGVTKNGENIVKGHEASGRNELSHARNGHQELITQHAEELNNGIVHPDVRRALQQRAFREGTASVRRKVIADGYKPTAEEADSRPLGLLTGYQGAEYLPKQKLTPKAEKAAKAIESQTPYRRIKQVAPTPKFNLPQRIGNEEAPLSERILDRLNKGASVENYYKTRENILRDLGLAPESSRPAETFERFMAAKAEGNEKKADRLAKLLSLQHEAIKGGEEKRLLNVKPNAENVAGTNIPEAIHRRLFGDIIKPRPGALRDLSDASRDAMFGLTSLPHKKNIAIMQMMGPAGAKGFVRGLGYARKIKKGDASIAGRVKALESVGGTEHFIRGTEPVYEKFGPIGHQIARRSNVVNKSLDRYETGQRLALMDELQRRGVTGFNAGGEIRDILGDYKNQSPLVEKLRNDWGAPFPQFHLGIVPKAVSRAVMKEPRRVRAMVRAQNNLNQDVMEPRAHVDYNLGGPLNEGLGMVNPKKYLSSQSDTGPLGQFGRDFDYLKSGNVKALGEDFARTYVPGASQIEDISSLSPFKQTGANNIANFGAGMIGSYFSKAPTAKQKIRLKLEEQGIPAKEIDGLIRRLGTK